MKKQSKKIYILPATMLGVTAVAGAIASIPQSSAEDISPIDDNIAITVDSACTMGQTTISTNPTINPGETGTIGTSRIAAYCNDANGYDIYAIGYTNAEYGNTNMINTTGNTIPTGLSGEGSYWNIHLAPGTATGTTSYIPTVESSFTTNTIIPNDYAKVASFPSSTISQRENPLEYGSYIDATYTSHISTTQPAGAYTGQVQYVMVHPTGAPAPEKPLALYDAVKSLVKKDAGGNERTQTLAQMQEAITAPDTTDPSTDTSNSGVYKYDASVFGTASDASNDYAIYYYRGRLEPTADQGTYGSDGKATTYPNYVKLGNNTCWRIVRTTGSGGVKMIYNGAWTGNTCANNTTNAQLTTSAFNSTYNSIVYAGYTYNSNYTNNASTNGVSTDIVLGSNDNPAQNNTRSTIKTYIEDTWYANNMASYTNKLEPAAGYCNDRSLYDNNYNPISNVDTSQNNRFGAAKRNFVDNSTGPSLTCPRGDVDNYHYVANSAGVSNELKYPAALLTADESALAGSGRSSGNPTTYNTKSFLRSGYDFWLLSPNRRDSSGTAFGFYLRSYGNLNVINVDVVYGVRPSISLNHETTVASGSGTATDPWTINE